MVTREEAIASIEQARQQIEQQKQTIENQRRAQQLSQQQLRSQTPQSALQTLVKAKQNELTNQQALQNVKDYESQVNQYEQGLPLPQEIIQQQIQSQVNIEKEKINLEMDKLENRRVELLQDRNYRAAEDYSVILSGYQRYQDLINQGATKSDIDRLANYYYQSITNPSTGSRALEKAESDINAKISQGYTAEQLQKEYPQFTFSTQTIPSQTTSVQTQNVVQGGTYNPSTNTYTSPEGYKMSMAQSDAEKRGAVIVTSVIPQNVVTQAPTFTEQYKKNVGEQGYVKGTLNFLGEKVSGQLSENKLSPVYRSGYAAPVGKLASTTIQTAPYFIPYVGAGLMVGSGAEDIINLRKGSESRIVKQQEYLTTEKGYNPLVSTAISYGTPVAEIVGGGLFLRGEIKAAQQSRELKLFEATPTQVTGLRVEGENGGLDLLFGYKKVGKTEYFTEVKQPFYRVNDNKVVLESGTGTAFAKQDNKLTATSFEQFGRFYNTENAPSIIKEFGKTKIKQVNKLEEAQGGFGRIITKTKVRITGKLTKGYNPLKNRDLSLDYWYKIERPKNEISRVNVLGIGKEEGNIIKVVGSKAEKLKIDKWTGETISVKGKLDIFGKIRRVNAPSTSNDIISIGKVLKRKQKSVSGYEQSLVKQALKTTLSPVKTIIPSRVGGSLIGSVTQTEKNNLPLMVGGTGLETIPYSGTGKYEKTEGGLTPQDWGFTQLEEVSSKIKEQPSMIQISAPLQITKEETNILSLTSQLQTTSAREELKNILFNIQSQPEVQAERYKQVLLSKQKLKNDQSTNIRPRPYNPLRPPTIIIDSNREIGVKTEKSKSGILEGEQGYYTEVKEKGKWKKVLNKILSKEDAKDLGLFTTDNILAASFRLKKAKGKPTAKDIVKSMGLELKFRDYKINKGKKIPLKDNFIEKRKYRLDTPNEVQTLQKFRKSAQFKNIFRTNKKPSRKKQSMGGWI